LFGEEKRRKGKEKDRMGRNGAVDSFGFFFFFEEKLKNEKTLETNHHLMHVSRS
jgi:hypothetical protein